MRVTVLSTTFYYKGYWKTRYWTWCQWIFEDFLFGFSYDFSQTWSSDWLDPQSFGPIFQNWAWSWNEQLQGLSYVHEILLHDYQKCIEKGGLAVKSFHKEMAEQLAEELGCEGT